MTRSTTTKWPLGSLLLFGGVLSIALADAPLQAETLRHPQPLEAQLKNAGIEHLAVEARKRGDARRGAVLFYKSPAACASCHLHSDGSTPLGPDLATIGTVTDEYLIESLISPSKAIRKGFETHSILTADGEILVGMIGNRDQDQITLRLASDLTQDKVVSMDDIETIRTNKTSMMPDGLVASLTDQRDFLDLAKYVMLVTGGGQKTAAELKPTEMQLAVVDDTANLDHAGIISKLRQRDFDAGHDIYHGYCFNCHGSDGNTPSLPTARAFGTQKLKFGADPYRMFLTLSHGNGLMSPMSHLTPKERYQVVHYVRESFMKPSNPDYVKITDEYLDRLPKGTENGTKVADVPRDHGLALGSQLRRQYSSVLSIPLGKLTIAYDLHSMNQAGLWSDGFLDLTQTQHVRDRGEGTANPKGSAVKPAARWHWGHDGTLDYDRSQIQPRSPIPTKWMNYRGYHVAGNKIVLSYEIDGRSVWESPSSSHKNRITHAMHIGAGRSLVLHVADGFSPSQSSRDPFITNKHVGFGIRGDIDGLNWQVDDRGRLSLHFPADSSPRDVEILRAWDVSLQENENSIRSFISSPALPSTKTLVGGGPLLWPEVVETVGTLGLEAGGYVLDTITIPDATTSNTWFRTSALDFFDDGRMAVSTYGGDVWIVSGIDDELMNLKWKRFAAGLYEPFGLKVIDNQVHVTCKDRIVRLHDQDENGEADFYESFSADPDVSVNFHAFNFDLQTDQDGYLYYSKSGHGADSDLPGVVYKVSPNGKTREIYSTGFRTPNGMGLIPGDESSPVRIFNSDNQGQWMPAGKINLLKPGGYYGWVPTYSIPGMWEPGGGKIDITQVTAPETFNPPVVWMPQEFDNSSGGQIWVDDDRFGPLSRHLLHTSFGKGWMSYLMLQDVGEISQAAIIKLPFNFSTGIMRGRVNPTDGQVYATGLQGWNGGGRIGLADGGIQRLRYTGKPSPMVTNARVVSGGLEIDFNFKLDRSSASNVSSYVAQQWDYRWSRNYGSDQYLPGTEKPGTEKLKIDSIQITSLPTEGTRVKLFASEISPVDQLHLRLDLKSTDGKRFQEEIYWTINAIPAAAGSATQK